MRRPFQRLIGRIFDRKPKLEKPPPTVFLPPTKFGRYTPARDPVKGRAKRRRIRKLARASRKRNRTRH